MSTELLDRKYRIVLGTTEITGLKCEFSVAKSLKKEPNTCTIKVYNLSDQTRESISNPKKVSVLLEAGYGDAVSQIFKGELRSATSEVDGPNIVTTLTSGDGEKAIQKARLNIPVGAKTPPGTVLQKIADALKKEGIGLGNTAAAVAKLEAKGYVLYPVSTVVSGKTSQIMTDFCRSAGLEWSIQDGRLQIFDLGKSLDDKPLILRADTGLIGSPSVDSDGVVNATVFMIPEVRPGMRVVFDSRFVKGLYRIKHADYSGDTYGDDWTIKLACDDTKKKKK